MPVVNDMSDEELAAKLLESIDDAPNGVVAAIPADDPQVVIEVRRYDGTAFVDLLTELRSDLNRLTGDANRLARRNEQLRQQRDEGVRRLADLVDHLDADLDGTTDNDLLRQDLVELWDATAPGTRALTEDELGGDDAGPGSDH